jgi:hypothetical protein
MTSTNQSDPDTERSGAYCSECGAALSGGARFCHRCGTPVDRAAGITARPPARVATLLAWLAAAVSLAVVVAILAAKDPPTRPSAPGDIPARAVDSTSADVMTGRPPDIGSMTPSERANRLYVRVMQYAEAGFTDSVARFAPMVIAAHQMLQSPTDDERYHFGRAAEVIGSMAIAKAQADTLLQRHPSSLLGLLLAARTARIEQRDAVAAEFDKRLLTALERELASGNGDYENHRAEIDRAVADARRRP